MKRLQLILSALLVMTLLFGCESKESTKRDSRNDRDKEDTEETQESTQRDEDKVPDFTVYDLEGKEVRLSDFEGTPVVLNFWASWCPPCKAEMPDFQEAFEKWGDDVKFLIVNMTDGRTETVETAQEFIEDQGYTFPVYFDTDMEAAIAYQVQSIPCTYFIDEDGYLVSHQIGMISAQKLKKGIQEICE